MTRTSIRIAEDLVLPLEAVTQAFGILAKRRAGKSFTARRFIEQLFKADQQVAIVDPKGDWWGIRSAADGRAPGLPIVILGGEHADAPLEASAGEVVAKLAVEERVSLLLDLSLFRKHELATFMTGSLENLYRLKARETFRTPMMLMVDEADAVAPQKPMRGEERMLGAAEDIVRRGGQRGIGCTLVSQRSAVINKNVLTQIQVLVALRTIAPQDLEALNAWIDVHGSEEERKTLMGSLPSLPVGDAWFWSPGWPSVEGIFQRVHVAPIETFDSGATPDQRKRVEPKKAADVDLEALKRQMAATLERAKADDPRELRRQLEELRAAYRPLAADLAPGGGPKEVRAALHKLMAERGAPAAKPKVVEVPLLKGPALARLSSSIERGQKLAAQLEELGDAYQVAAVDLAAQLAAAVAAIDRQADALERAAAPPAIARPAPRPAPAPRAAAVAARREPAAGQLVGAQQRIVDALAELEVLHVDEPERVQVAFFAGYTNLNSKGLVNGLGALSSAGLIVYPRPGFVALTPSGRANARARATPRTAQELQERVVSMLGGASERLLRPLIAAHPAAVDRQDLAAAAGYGNLNSKGFVNALGRLRSLGFIDYPSPGQVAAQPVLFLEGRG